ncbi:hypothetical protein IscW_ISCW006700 [Ixodes scapularis]|uniref:Uncharacterized protein n=1 Tax=Ixodes scapularis TaxID=6945 RepID=B7PPL1_IXOSC|nr:hypothetical protein IscW_ISCW006700 [Ixodes scapularis]|eukprot:XP_002435703.1 hypothetical protein IscW_ISCW006700 [Ixodes scapularis]
MKLAGTNQLGSHMTPASFVPLRLISAHLFFCTKDSLQEPKIPWSQFFSALETKWLRVASRASSAARSLCTVLAVISLHQKPNLTSFAKSECYRPREPTKVAKQKVRQLSG